MVIRANGVSETQHFISSCNFRLPCRDILHLNTARLKIASHTFTEGESPFNGASTYFNIFAPFFSFFVFFPFEPLVNESLESESELGIIVILELLSRSSFKNKKNQLASD